MLRDVAFFGYDGSSTPSATCGMVVALFVIAEPLKGWGSSPSPTRWTRSSTPADQANGGHQHADRHLSTDPADGSSPARSSSRCWAAVRGGRADRAWSSSSSRSTAGMVSTTWGPVHQGLPAGRVLLRVDGDDPEARPLHLPPGGAQASNSPCRRRRRWRAPTRSSPAAGWQDRPYLRALYGRGGRSQSLRQPAARHNTYGDISFSYVSGTDRSPVTLSGRRPSRRRRGGALWERPSPGPWPVPNGPAPVAASLASHAARRNRAARAGCSTSRRSRRGDVVTLVLGKAHHRVRRAPRPSSTTPVSRPARPPPAGPTPTSKASAAPAAPTSSTSSRSCSPSSAGPQSLSHILIRYYP